MLNKHEYTFDMVLNKDGYEVRSVCDTTYSDGSKRRFTNFVAQVATYDEARTVIEQMEKKYA